jgi:2,3-diketo-5-methylthio-1-phosphopentane phosphatase
MSIKLIYFLFISGIRENDLKKCMTDIPVTDGMIELLKYCQDQNYETIIISDSNSVFIDMILENAQLTKMVTKVFTNPAYFDENGCLKIDYYHTQDWCDLSTVNLCKGHILQGYIQKRKQEGNQFDFILYVGDGTNDLCHLFAQTSIQFKPQLNLKCRLNSCTFQVILSVN